MKHPLESASVAVTNPVFFEHDENVSHSFLNTHEGAVPRILFPTPYSGKRQSTSRRKRSTPGSAKVHHQMDNCFHENFASTLEGVFGELPNTPLQSFPLPPPCTPAQPQVYRSRAKTIAKSHRRVSRKSVSSTAFSSSLKQTKPLRQGATLTPCLSHRKIFVKSNKFWFEHNADILRCWLNYVLNQADNVSATLHFSFEKQLTCIQNVLSKVTIPLARVRNAIRSGLLYMDKEIRLRDNCNAWEFLSKLLLGTYEPVWLLPCLAVIFRNPDFLKLTHLYENMATSEAYSTEFDQKASAYIKRLLKESLLAREATKPFDTRIQSRLGAACAVGDTLKALVLDKFISIIFILDRAKSVSTKSKCSTSNPPLFRHKSRYKSSVSVLKSFATAYLSSHGDVQRHLRQLEVVLQYEAPVLESAAVCKMPVCDVTSDLIDGTHVCKVASLLTNNPELLSKVTYSSNHSRCGADDATKRAKANICLAFTQFNKTDELMPAGFSWLRQIHSFRKEDKESVLTALWHLVRLWIRHKVIPEVPKVTAETERLLEILSEKPGAVEEMPVERKRKSTRCTTADCISYPLVLSEPTEDISSALLSWCKAVGRFYGKNISEWTESFSDGSMLCLLLHHYFPGLYQYEDIVIPKSSLHFTVMENLVHVETNFRLFCTWALKVGGIPPIPIPSEIAVAEPFTGQEKASCFGNLMQMLASYIFARAMKIPKDTKSKIIDAVAAIARSTFDDDLDACAFAVADNRPLPLWAMALNANCEDSTTSVLVAETDRDIGISEKRSREANINCQDSNPSHAAKSKLSQAYLCLSARRKFVRLRSVILFLQSKYRVERQRTLNHKQHDHVMNIQQAGRSFLSRKPCQLRRAEVAIRTVLARYCDKRQAHVVTILNSLKISRGRGEPRFDSKDGAWVEQHGAAFVIQLAFKRHKSKQFRARETQQLLDRPANDCEAPFRISLPPESRTSLPGPGAEARARTSTRPLSDIEQGPNCQDQVRQSLLDIRAIKSLTVRTFVSAKLASLANMDRIYQVAVQEFLNADSSHNASCDVNSNRSESCEGIRRCDLLIQELECRLTEWDRALTAENVKELLWGCQGRSIDMLLSRFDEMLADQRKLDKEHDDLERNDLVSLAPSLGVTIEGQNRQRQIERIATYENEAATNVWAATEQTAEQSDHATESHLSVQNNCDGMRSIEENEEYSLRRSSMTDEYSSTQFRCEEGNASTCNKLVVDLAGSVTIQPERPGSVEEQCLRRSGASSNHDDEDVLAIRGDKRSAKEEEQRIKVQEDTVKNIGAETIFAGRSNIIRSPQLCGGSEQATNSNIPDMFTSQSTFASFSNNYKVERDALTMGSETQFFQDRTGLESEFAAAEICSDILGMDEASNPKDPLLSPDAPSVGLGHLGSFPTLNMDFGCMLGEFDVPVADDQIFDTENNAEAVVDISDRVSVKHGQAQKYKHSDNFSLSSALDSGCVLSSTGQFESRWTTYASSQAEACPLSTPVAQKYSLQQPAVEASDLPKDIEQVPAFGPVHGKSGPISAQSWAPHNCCEESHDVLLRNEEVKRSLDLQQEMQRARHLLNMNTSVIMSRQFSQGDFVRLVLTNLRHCDRSAPCLSLVRLGLDAIFALCKHSRCPNDILPIEDIVSGVVRCLQVYFDVPVVFSQCVRILDILTSDRSNVVEMQKNSSIHYRVRQLCRTLELRKRRVSNLRIRRQRDKSRLAMWSVELDTSAGMATEVTSTRSIVEIEEEAFSKLFEVASRLN